MHDIFTIREFIISYFKKYFNQSKLILKSAFVQLHLLDQNISSQFIRLSSVILLPLLECH